MSFSAVMDRDYDLVLMDVHMPALDGVQATRAIVGSLPPDQLPCIVAMTASALDEERESCLEAGMDGFLPKPVSLAELARVLESVPRRGASSEAADREGDAPLETVVSDARVA